MSPNTRSPCLRHKQKRGEVSASYADGGGMSRTDAVAHDLSTPVRRGHLPFVDSAKGEES